jgi:hypothetical protein
MTEADASHSISVPPDFSGRSLWPILKQSSKAEVIQQLFLSDSFGLEKYFTNVYLHGL